MIGADLQSKTAGTEDQAVCIAGIGSGQTVLDDVKAREGVLVLFSVQL